MAKIQGGLGDSAGSLEWTQGEKTLALEPDEVGLSVPHHHCLTLGLCTVALQQITSKPRSFKQQTVTILHSGSGIQGASGSGPLVRAQSRCWLGYSYLRLDWGWRIHF